jgi:hypothetical protein
MRNLIRGAIRGARDQLYGLATGMLADRTPTEEELVRRYITKHRGNPDALIDFARRNAPPGSNPVTEAVRYEQEMERLIQARGG